LTSIKALLMRKKLIARTAKILSESKRGRKHQGIAVAYEHIPNDGDERNHGSIYALINVKASSESAEEVAEVITDAFHSEFYLDLNRDPMSSFEIALTKINESLAEITHQGNIGWLNNINAVLAVISDSVIYVTQTGKAEAYLYRAGKSSNITKDLSGDSINPLRTFTYTAAGELIEGDKVAIVTPGVFYHVSKDELQRYVEEFQPKVAVSHLADLLESNSSEMQPNSLLIIEAITPEAASEETLTEIKDEIWLSEPNKPVETVVEASAPFAKKTFFYLKKYSGIIATFITATAFPFIQNAALDSYDFVKESIKKRKVDFPKKNAKMMAHNKLEEPANEAEISESVLEELTINETANSLVGKDVGQVIHIKETTNKPKWLKLEKIDFSYAKKIQVNLSKTFGGTKKHKRFLLIAAVSVLVVALLGSYIFWQNKENAEKQQLADATYTEAVSKLDIAKTKIASGDLPMATSTLDSALKLTTSLKSNPAMKDKATTLETSINKELDIAGGVTRVQSKLLGDASKIAGTDSIGPITVGKNLYVISKDSGNIAAVNIASGEVSSVLDKPNLNGKFVLATAVPTRNVIVLFSDKGGIYEFDTVDLAINKQNVSGDVEVPSGLASFSTNIYTIDKDTGAIYRRQKVTGGYGARTDYIKDGSNVKGAISLAIDSNIYASFANGSIIKYLGGTKQTYATSGAPFTISKATSIFTDETTTGIYMTDGSSSRIIYYDGTGKFVKQLVSESFKGAVGNSVSDTTKTIYVLAGGKVYKANL